MARMSEQTKQEFKVEVMRFAMDGLMNGSYSDDQTKEIKRALEFVFKQAHIRGEYDESHSAG